MIGASLSIDCMYLVSDDVSEYTYSLETVLGAAALKLIYELFINNNTNNLDLSFVEDHIQAMEEEYPTIIINGEY